MHMLVSGLTYGDGYHPFNCYSSSLYIALTCLQVHGPDSDGDRSAQVVEDTET